MSHGHNLNAAIRDIEMPMRMTRLPLSEQGYPVPWFVGQVDGQWDFRMIGPDKVVDAYKKRLCWLCGEKLGTYLAFVIGPMCSINRVTSECPCHLECAQYATRACPFLSKPRMRRNAVDLPDHPAIAGDHIDHNPGAVAIWITKGYRPFKVPGGSLFRLDKPTNVLWYAEGRPATRQQVLDAIDKGLPHLRSAAAQDGPKAMKELDGLIREQSIWLPKEATHAGQVRPSEHSG